MKVLLVSANRERQPQPVFPIGISYVARALEPDHEVRLADVLVDGLDGLAATIATFAPDLVGLSLRNVDDTRPGGRTQVDGYREVARAIRGATDAPLVLGGSAYTLFPDRYLAELGADFGIAGEGEHLRLLVDALAAGRDPDTVRDGAGVPGLHRPGRPGVPTVHWQGPVGHAAAADRLLAEYRTIGGMLNLQTKRGCSMRCCYCTYPNIEGRRLRNHASEALVDEVARLVAQGTRYLFFVDSVFNLDLDHTARMAEELIRRDIRVSWAGYFAPNRLTPDYAKLLRRAGLTHAEFGTESLCDPVLKAYGKPFHVDDVRAAHDALGQAGVHRAHFLIIAGPGETQDTVEQTIAVSRTLPDSVFFPFVTMRIYPGTPLHRRAVAEGVIAADDPLFEPVFYRSQAVPVDWLDERMRREGAERTNWVLDDSLDRMAGLVARLHARGRLGPLWEMLAR